MKIGVIGLGYVGLPVALMFAEAGFDVIGVDVNQKRVDEINAKVNPFMGEPGVSELLARVNVKAYSHYDVLADRDVILIDVETPVNDENIPEYKALKAALSDLAPVVKAGAIVVVESTIAPGTMKELVEPAMPDYVHLAHCPERVKPGRLLSNLRYYSRVIGTYEQEVGNILRVLYGNIVNEGDFDIVDPLTAEIVKCTENTYRDVQIAFANQMALICQELGADVWKVRELTNKIPHVQVHLPGSGVGGHCIPKDPHLLMYGARDLGVDLSLLKSARWQNDFMPYWVACMIPDGRPLICGYSYDANVGDTRNSPTIDLEKFLDPGYRIHDPFVEGYQGDLYEVAAGCSSVVFMIEHNEYRDVDLERLYKSMNPLINPVIVDGRNIIDAQKARGAGFIYTCIGKG